MKRAATTALVVGVDAGDPLVTRYDADKSGEIEKSEVITAINDYLFGTGDDTISKADVIAVINHKPLPLRLAQGTHRTGRYRKEGSGCFSGCRC